MRRRRSGRRGARRASAASPPQRRGLGRRIAVIPPGAGGAGSCFLLKCVRDAGTSKETTQGACGGKFGRSRILSELSGIKEHRRLRTRLRAQPRDTSCRSHSCASFRGFRNYPGDEGGARRAAGAHQRRRGRGAKPGRGGRDAESRRSSPGILLSARAERALSRRAAIKPAELTALLPGELFKIRRAITRPQGEAIL